MRMLRLVPAFTVALATALAGAATLAPSPAAASGSGIWVSPILIDQGPYRADGLTTVAAVPITVGTSHGLGPIGACPAYGWSARGPVATLERVTGGARTSVQVPLAFSSDTGYTTLWKGTWLASSTRNGTWTLTRVDWCVPSLNAGIEAYRLPQSWPAEGRSAVVVGTRPPSVTAEGVPAVVPFGARQWVRYTYRANDGMPLVNWPVVVRFTRGACSLVSGRLMTTDSLGRLAVPVYAGETTCVRLMSRPTSAGTTGAELRLDQASRYEHYRGVSATASAAAVRTGRTLTVLGNVIPALGWVALQRQEGRTWVNVAVARVRSNGRYMLATTSLPVGSSNLRVVAQGARGLAPTPSRVVVVTGTAR